MRLKKLALAATIAAGFAAPALAQSSVQLYGKLYPYLIDESGHDPTPVGTPVATFAAAPTGVSGISHSQGMAAGNSRLGFRGTEDLGGNLKAFFQLEGTAAVDSGGGGNGFMFNRDTYVGIGGGFGTFKLGNMDTVFKEYGDTIGILGISSGTFMSTSDVLRKTGFGTSSASSFHLRRANSVQYRTPEFHDIEAAIQYSTDEAPSSDFRKPTLWSLGVRYDAGPLYFSIAHEIHKDFFGGSRNVASSMRNNGNNDFVHSNDHATQAAVEWRINKVHKVEFDAIRKSYAEDGIATGRFQSYSNMAYLFAFENRWTDNFRTAGHIVRATKGDCSRVNTATCSTDGLEATKYLLAAGYNFSKRTMVFTAFSVIKNGKSARYNNSEFGREPTPGEDIRQFAVGISHTF